MTDPYDDQSGLAPVKDTDDARAGYETGRIRWILRISMALVVLALFWLLLSWTRSH